VLFISAPGGGAERLRDRGKDVHSLEQSTRPPPRAAGSVMIAGLFRCWGSLGSPIRFRLGDLFGGIPS